MSRSPLQPAVELVQKGSVDNGMVLYTAKTKAINVNISSEEGPGVHADGIEDVDEFKLLVAIFSQPLVFF